MTLAANSNACLLLLLFKAEVLMKIREMILQCDRVMKAVTVAYCQMQHRLASPAPIQFEALCEKSQLYEPGTSIPF